MKAAAKQWQALFWLLFACVLALACVRGFSGLANAPVYDWDEARHGVNAYEMVKSGNYIVHTFEGQPDYWNTKPPLSMWLTALGYRIFGTGTLGLRFFSAFSLPVSAAAAMLFLRKALGCWAALTTGVLLAGAGSRFYHLFRTGDPDALFFLCCLLTCVFLYLGLNRSHQWLAGAGLGLAFAFLTKSFHIAPLVLVVLITLVLFRKSLPQIKQLALWLVLPAAAPVLLWAALRFGADGTAFFREMLYTDILGRVTSSVEGHAGGFFFYPVVLHNLMGPWLTWGILLLLAAAGALRITGLVNGIGDRLFLVIFGGMLFWPLLVFTLSSTKLGWYGYPCLIGFFFLAGYAVELLAAQLQQPDKRRGTAVLLAACAMPVAVGLAVEPVPDLHNRASTSSANSVFAQAEDPSVYAGMHYYVAHAQGTAAHTSQSWLLHSLYLGLEKSPGGLDAFFQDRGALLVLQCDSLGQLEAFLAEHPALVELERSGVYALLRHEE